MALRPDIALQTQGIKLPDFAGAYESMLNNRARREAMAQNNEVHRVQMDNIRAQEEQRRQENERRAKLEAAVQTGDRKAIALVDPKLAADLDKADTEKAAAQRKAEADQFDLVTKKADRALKLLSGINNDATLRGAIAQIQQDAEMSQAVPVGTMLKLAIEGYTPENAKLLQDFGLSLLDTKEKVALQKTQQEMSIAAKVEDRNAAKAPLEIAKLTNEVITGTPDPVTGLPPAQTAQINLQRDQFNETKRHNERMEKLRGSEIYLQSQKAEMDRADRIAKEKGMSQESAKVYAIAETIVPELEQLRDAIAADPKKSVAGILSGWNTKLVRLAENAADKVGRLRSGGAVNPNEEKRFMAQIARLADLKDGDGKSAVEAINNYITEAQTVKAKMQPGVKSANPANPASPKPGTIEDGYLFIGGNPADPKNWKKK